VLAAALTHTLTHTRKRTDGTHGAKSFDLILFAVKMPAKPYIPTAGGLFITW